MALTYNPLIPMNLDDTGDNGAFSIGYVDQSGGTSDTYGVLSGAINGTNTTFTVSQSAYSTGKLKVYLNGQLQTQGTGEDWVETTPGSGTFDFTTAPVVGDEILVAYGYDGGAGGMSNFNITADSGTDQTITDSSTMDVAGGTLVNTVVGATDQITINVDGSSGTNGQVITTDGTTASFGDPAGDGKVGVDVSATPDYLGTSTSNGVLRTDTSLDYADYGDYIIMGIETDGVDNTHIDWGTGVQQVSAEDMPIEDSGSIITATQVEGALQENRTAIDLNTTHRSSNGSDHSYLNQSVISGSSPTLDGTNFTGIPNSALEDTYVNANGSVALTSDWDIGDTNKILADEIRARDVAGLKLYDDGSNGIFVEDGGYVGIGTDNPTVKLEVAGEGNQDTATISVKRASAFSTAPTIKFYNANGDLTTPTAVVTDDVIGQFSFGGYDGSSWVESGMITSFATEVWSVGNEGSGFAFRTTPNGSSSSAERMRIDQDGNVGIGTDSPAQKVEIIGNMMIGRSTVTDDTNKYFRYTGGHYDSDEEPIAGILTTSSATNNYIYVGGGSSLCNTATTIRFHTAADTTTTIGTCRMVIDLDGNVGIGTATPDAKLDVVGSILLGSSKTGGTSKSNILGGHQYDTAGEPEGYTMIMGWSNLTDNSLCFGGCASSLNAATNIKFATAANNTTRAGSIRMFIDKDGKVGIGTTTPDYKLQVNGTIAPETTNQDLGTSSLRWDTYAHDIDINGAVTIDGNTGWNGWFDDGANFRVTVTDGIITGVANSTSGGHS